MLLNLIPPNDKIISIIGLAKNTGKTTALNHLLKEAHGKGITIGITSIGRDGESIDLVTEKEKPKIQVEKGTIIATARELVDFAEGNIEVIRTTDFYTPLGKVIIGRVSTAGHVQIAGPQKIYEIKKVADMMLDLGANLVVLDGALDRRSSAAPSISHSSILSTGAVLSKDMNKVIEESKHEIDILSLPTIEGGRERNIIKGLMDENQIGIIDKDFNIEKLNIKTAINSGQIIGKSLKDESKYIVLPGALVKNTLEDIILTTRKYKDVIIVVKEGTRIFINRRDWLKYEKYGIQVKVVYPIKLIGITLNPHSPQGYNFNPGEFLEKIKSQIQNIPIIDVIFQGRK